MQSYLRYSPDVEKIEADEHETRGKIIEVMSKGVESVRKDLGRSVRISHAKAFAILKGKLEIKPNLSVELAQGLFARPAVYDVIVRMANAPGEINDDSKVTTARGMAIKILSVPGTKIANHTDDSQDFLLENGKEFFVGNVKAFLQAFKPNAELAPKLSDTVKGAVSSIAEVTNKGLNAIGINSEKLDFYGHSQMNPMGEPNFSQIALRHGDYIAKMGVFPDTPGMKALADEKFDPQTPDALREATQLFFGSNPAEYSVRIQLNTGLDDMPVEDPQAKWSEDLSPYVEVARLVLPPQKGWDQTLDGFAENLSFSPANSLEEHRALGSIARARFVVYKALSTLRLKENGESQRHIDSSNQIPV